MRLQVPTETAAALAALVSFQLPQAVEDQLPQWALVVVVAVTATVAVLDKFGVLRRFGGGDHSAKIHALLATRGDDGVERFLRHGQHLESIQETATELARGQAGLAEGQARLAAAHESHAQAVGLWTQELRLVRAELARLDKSG